MRHWIVGLLAATTLGGGGVAVYVADQAQNPYIDRGDRYELPTKVDIPQGERVEIHKASGKIDLIGWNDEYRISIEPQIPSAALGAVDRPFQGQVNRPLLSNRMEYTSGNVTAFIQPRSDNEFDIDFTLDAKPDTNVFTYKISGAEDFDFYYQPALTQQEIDEGMNRPDNVVGSYAVYSKTRRDHRIGSTNYATGKIAHIYRPKAIDANGTEVWAELSYDAGVLSVTVPQSFLDSAIYPVTVDPTLGYTTLGSTNSYIIANATSDESKRTGVKLPGVTGTVTSIFLGLNMLSSTDTIDITAFINTVNDGANSHALLTSTSTLELSVTSTPTWYTFTPTSGSLVFSDDYIVGAVGNGEDVLSTSNPLYITADSAGTPIYIRNNYIESFTGAGSYATSLEDPWTVTKSGVTIYVPAIYFTYSCTDCIEYYMVPGTYSWTAPDGVTSVSAACWGAGGGGGDGSIAGGAGGGGGGAFASSTVTVTPGNSYEVVVGAGGAHGATNAAGSDGATSTFNGTSVVAAPGKGGGAAAGAGGAGGSLDLSTGDVEFAGAAGGAGVDVSTNDDSGGGGGSGGPHGTGGAGADGDGTVGGGGGGGNGGSAGSQPTGGSSTYGGAGGDGGNGAAGSNGTGHRYGGGGGGGGDNGTTGGYGGFPGGGGGGGETNSSAGAHGVGGNGQCTLTYTISAGGGGGSSSFFDIIFFN